MKLSNFRSDLSSTLTIATHCAYVAAVTGITKIYYKLQHQNNMIGIRKKYREIVSTLKTMAFQFFFSKRCHNFFIIHLNENNNMTKDFHEIVSYF